MPLPADPELKTLSEDTIAELEKIFGTHPGFRPVHARGAMLKGTFVPTPEAESLSTAPHFNQQSTPVTVRFSSSTGLPHIPDTDPEANPRALAVRFELGAHVHTDIISHSTPAFPVRTGQEFLSFFRAISNGTVPEFLATHPAAAAFVQFPKPFPTSLAREAYYALHAFKFTNAEGVSRFGRYSIVPVDGPEYLSDDAVKAQEESYLYDELPTRISRNEPISFYLVCQLAREDDPVNDSTIQWPESADRPRIILGKISLNAVVEDNLREAKKIIFDPVPRVKGIEAADDPLFEARAAVYLISGRRRRAAPDA
ncbi:catalase related subgroup [Mycena amicta]|nr:catalase related subgroup [Mycena amicta]